MHQRWLLAATTLGVVWGAAAIAFDVPLLVVDFLLHLGPTVVGVGALVALIGWRPAGPATFAVADDAFYAPTNRRRTVEVAALILVSISQAALAVDRLRADGALFDAILSVLLVLLAAALLLRSLVVPTRLELRPRGLRIPGRLHTIDVPWKALRPGTPWAPRLRTQKLELLLGRSYLVMPPSERRAQLDVAIDVLDVHPWFLADTIRYYVAHPEHRESIGRPAELDRLVRRLRDGGAPPALPPGPPPPLALPPAPRGRSVDQAPTPHRR